MVGCQLILANIFHNVYIENSKTRNVYVFVILGFYWKTWFVGIFIHKGFVVCIWATTAQTGKPGKKKKKSTVFNEHNFVVLRQQVNLVLIMHGESSVHEKKTKKWLGVNWLANIFHNVYIENSKTRNCICVCDFGILLENMICGHFHWVYGPFVQGFCSVSSIWATSNHKPENQGKKEKKNKKKTKKQPQTRQHTKGNL